MGMDPPRRQGPFVRPYECHAMALRGTESMEIVTVTGFENWKQLSILVPSRNQLIRPPDQ